MISYRISKDDDGSRCDRVVVRLLQISFPTAQKLFRKGCVKVDGVRVRDGSTRVHRDSCVEVHARESATSTTSIPKSSESRAFHIENLYRKFDVVWDCDDYLVINKESGMPVQGGSGIIFSIDALLRQCDYHLVHRLDRDTSGLLVIAKHRAAARDFTRIFRENRVHKEYYAVVYGKVTGDGCIQNFLSKGSDGRVRVSVEGQRAVTYYRAIYSDNTYSVLQLQPKTGRTHQLRVHCADVLSAPIVGDRRYCKRTSHDTQSLRLHLHAARITLDRHEISASFPDYFYKTCPSCDYAMLLA